MIFPTKSDCRISCYTHVVMETIPNTSGARTASDGHRAGTDCRPRPRQGGPPVGTDSYATARAVVGGRASRCGAQVCDCFSGTACACTSHIIHVIRNMHHIRDGKLNLFNAAQALDRVHLSLSISLYLYLPPSLPLSQLYSTGPCLGLGLCLHLCF